MAVAALLKTERNVTIDPEAHQDTYKMADRLPNLRLRFRIGQESPKFPV